MNPLADNIRLFRKQKGWSQKELGQKLKVSQTAIFYWEKGTREPDVKTIRELSELFGVSPNDLYGVIEEDTTAHQFHVVCDWLDLAGFEVVPLDEYGNFQIQIKETGEDVTAINEHDLINLCQRIVEQGEELKENFITEKLKLLFEK